MATKTEIDIYDLDETLLRGNSTRLFLDTLLRVSFRRWQTFTWLRTAMAAALRLSRAISHRRYKWLLWHAAGGLSQGAAADFREEYARRFVKMLRPSMLKALDRSRCDGHHILVATAAYVEVLSPLQDHVDGVVATETAAVAEYSDYVECRADEKARRALRYVKERDASVGIIYTDGKDDGPLLAAFPQSMHRIVLPDS
mgnify:CR=1 FL=1